MGFEVGCVDHDPVGFASSAGQFGEDAVGRPKPAPTHEPVIDRLVRAIPLGSIASHQAMLDDVDDARDNPAVINPLYAMRPRVRIPN